MEQNYPESLSTQTAMEKLINGISLELTNYEYQHSMTRQKKIVEYFLFSNYISYGLLSIYHRISLLLLFFCCFFLLIAYSLYDNRSTEFLFQVIILFILKFVNCLIVYWENEKRIQEVPNLVKKLLKQLKDWKIILSWQPKNYPNLNLPFSPCITLQWAIRDGNLINLPWPLLVEGDVILMRPGQQSPGKCEPLNAKLKSKRIGESILNYGDTYTPQMDGIGEGLSSPKARNPLKEEAYIMLETPFLSNLRLIFENALDRPVSVFNKRIVNLLIKVPQFICLPFLLILTFIIVSTRLYYDIWSGYWLESYIVLPVSIVLPLLPLFSPLIWVTLNWLSIASILTLCDHSKNLQKPASNDEFEDIEAGEFLLKPKSGWKNVRNQFFLVAWGRQEGPVRCVNPVHVLASVTNLCCVDKKGVLSWPNPTAEKIFFLRYNERSNTRDSFSSADSDDEQDKKIYKSDEPECVVMSLSHDHVTSFGLQFDDVTWAKFLPNLKPLGLNILVNTCNPVTQDHYSRFCSHISCQAIFNEHLVPVSQRRCLCELPKQVGFKLQAASFFNLKHQLSTFRHVPSTIERRNRFARSLSSTRLKFPFPHMVGVVLKDKCSKKLEIMSQGTSDIILDICSDYWDGRDVRPLTDKERKKILDFYNRTSLSGYCTAFSYRPTNCDIRRNISNFYMELPIDHARFNTLFTPHVSTEALCGVVDHQEYDFVNDISDCFEMQNKQIFIGMVTMQYQARIDMVRLIEELEESCIRFIHFSKENELRSRVFSEKMGLESGWNCHISLLPDGSAQSGNKNKSDNIVPGHLDCEVSNFTADFKHIKVKNIQDAPHRSYSAPSAVNVDLSKKSDELSVSSQTSSCEDGRSRDDLRKKIISNETLEQNKGEILPLISFDERSRNESERKSENEVNLVKNDTNFGENDKNLNERETNFIENEKTFNKEHFYSKNLLLQKNKSINFDSNLKEYSSNKSLEKKSSDNLKLTTKCLETEDNMAIKSSNNDNLSQKFSEKKCNNLPSEIQNSENSDSSRDSQLSLVEKSASQEATSSCDQTASLKLYDMSNRARLPKGIENIRPHIENVDNVPLLVSLFTDCNMDSTAEMIGIMQSYKEVVIVVGSVANAENLRVFMRADLCIGLEPTYPQVCVRQPVFVPHANKSVPPPTKVAQRLMSLPCSLVFERDDRVSLIQIILESRTWMENIMNCFQFWIGCSISISFLQFLTVSTFLPPIFSSGDVLWFVSVPVPLISISLVCTSANKSILNKATGKNDAAVTKESIQYVLFYYVSKFLPSIFVILLTYMCILSSYCLSYSQLGCNYVYPSNSSSFYTYISSNSFNFSNDSVNSLNFSNSTNIFYSDTCIQHKLFNSLLIAQKISGFQLILYFSFTSLCFVHKMHQFWVRNPFLNQIWILACLLAVLTQLLYSFTSFYTSYSPFKHEINKNSCSSQSQFWDVNFKDVIFMFMWPLFLVPLNELIKRYEIGANVRYQKRAKLEFGTKLGMNSPF